MAAEQLTHPQPAGATLKRYEQNLIKRVTKVPRPAQEWRRLFSELLGTFFPVLVAAGGGLLGEAFPGVISQTAAVMVCAGQWRW